MKSRHNGTTIRDVHYKRRIYFSFFHFLKGIKEQTIEIAKNLLKENIDVETISKATGLTEEELKNIK